jgi:hypothetical protein
LASHSKPGHALQVWRFTCAASISNFTDYLHVHMPVKDALLSPMHQVATSFPRGAQAHLHGPAMSRPNTHVLREAWNCSPENKRHLCIYGGAEQSPHKFREPPSPWQSTHFRARCGTSRHRMLAWMALANPIRVGRFCMLTSSPPPHAGHRHPVWRS